MPPVFLSSRITVLEMDAGHAALGVFRQCRGRLRLDEYAVEDLSAATGRDDDWLENTATALRALRSRTRPSGPVVLVFPAHLVLTKFIKIPHVATTKRAKVVRFEAAQSIPYPLAEVVWDSTVVGERDGNLEVMLAAAKLDAVEPLCAAAQAAGFEPRHVLPSPLATLAGFRFVHASQLHSALVLNLGARSTTVLLADRHHFITRTLPIGDNAGLAVGNVEEFATRLFHEVTRSVLHFRQFNALEKPARVHLTGGGARLAGLAEALAVKLKVPVGHLDALGPLEIAGAAAQTDVAKHGLMFADMLGAAAMQLRPGQPQLNLLPPRRSRRENFRQRQPWLLLAAGLAVAALLPPIIHWRNVATTARRKTAVIERELVPLRECDARIRANLQQLETLRLDAGRLQGIYDRRTVWLNLLADLQDRLVGVEDVWLDELQVISAAQGGPVKLAISGRMLDRTNPVSPASPETFGRVKTMLTSMVDSPFVAAIEGERFDNRQPGILRFDFVLVTDPRRPL